MGIFDFVKQGVQEMLVQRPDDKKSLLVYKHPDPTIPAYAQLTVDADEAAVFFRDGAIVGTLRTAGAGQRHQLSSENIPFLGRIVDKVTGANIFLTDLYFVTTRPLFEQRFGGELGSIEDPLLGEMVTPRIFGTYAFQIVDPARFITGYVGLQAPLGNEELTRWIAGRFLNSVKTVVGEVCIAQQKSLLEMMALQNELAQAFLQRCPDFDDIGLKIIQIGQFQVNLADDDKKRLQHAQAEIGKAKRQAKIAAISVSQKQAEAAGRQFELDQSFQQDARYVQGLAGGDFARYAAGKAMIGAGEGMAQGGGGDGGGSPMMMGAGLGAGVAMAQALGGALQPQQGGAAARGPAPAGGAITCGACNASVPAGKFCAACGATLAPKPRFCSACGAPGVGASRFCAECGTAFPA